MNLVVTVLLAVLLAVVVYLIFQAVGLPTVGAIGALIVLIVALVGGGRLRV